jgi:hypothetical protein
MYNCKIIPPVQSMRREMRRFADVSWITKPQQPMLAYSRRIHLIDEQEHYENSLFFEFHCQQKRLDPKEYMWKEDERVWQNYYTDDAWRWDGCKWEKCYYYDPIDRYLSADNDVFAK